MASGVGDSIACLGLARSKGDVDRLKRISFSFSRKGRLLFSPSPTLYPGPLHHSQIGKSPSMYTLCITGLLTASSLQVLPRRSQSSAASLQHLGFCKSTRRCSHGFPTGVQVGTACVTADSQAAGLYFRKSASF